MKVECIIKGDVSQYVYMNMHIGFGEGVISSGRDRGVQMEIMSMWCCTLH